MSSPKTNLKKNFFWNLLGSSIYAFTSLIFLIIVTRINGIDEAGVFTFAFSNACVFHVFGIYAGRTFQVTEKDQSLSDGLYFTHRLLTTSLMFFLGLAFALLRGYTELKLFVVLILVIYKATDAFAETVYAVLQKANQLYKVGLSLLFKGLLGPAVFALVDLLTHNLTLACIAIVLVNLVVIAVYDLPMLKKTGFRLKTFDWKKSLKLFRLGFFTFVFTLLTQYLINASKYAIDSHGAHDLQTIYGIIIMPATVMILAANFLIHPFLLKIKDALKAQGTATLNFLVLKLSCAMAAFGALATLAGFLLGQPVFMMLYGVDISAELISLVIILVGATFYSLSFILSNVLIAMRKTASQALIFVVVSIAALILSNSLVISHGVFGAACAYGLSMLLLFILYVIIYLHSVRLLRHQIFLTPSEKQQLHTFVVLAYQESPFLENCIKSVTHQTLPTNVVIFTTTPNQHISALAKKYHLSIKTGQHTTIGGDFDSALNAADTTLITIAHQDDTYDPTYAEKIISAYQVAGSTTQIIFSDYYELRNHKKTYTNTNLKIKRLLLTPLKAPTFARYKWAKRFALRFGDAICCPAVTFNTKKVTAPLFVSKMSCNVDWQAWEKLSRKTGKFVFVNEPLMGHRIHVDSETSKTINDDRRSAEDLAVYKKFWPAWLAKKLTKTYKASEKSNQV